MQLCMDPIRNIKFSFLEEFKNKFHLAITFERNILVQCNLESLNAFSL
jgi:hypothetical protein